MGLEVGGYNDHTDCPKMGPPLLIPTCLILAIRTAKWPPSFYASIREALLDQKIGYAAHLAERVFAKLMSKNETIFLSAKKPWYKPNEEDVQK
jgi:hypothetical protein